MISDAEACIMEVLWELSPLATEDIASALAERQAWQLATIKTLLNRLLKKKAISATKDGRRFLYAPLLSRTEWQRTQSTALIDRVFGGQLAPLVAHFSNHRKLSAADIAELKSLIEGYEKKAKARRG